MSLWEKSGRFALLVVALAAVTAGARAAPVATPLDDAARNSPADVQTSALQHAVDAAPLTAQDLRYYERYYPYLYNGQAAWDSPERDAPWFYEPDPRGPSGYAPEPAFHRAARMSCIRPRVITIGHYSKQHHLPRVTYGAPLPCGYRG